MIRPIPIRYNYSSSEIKDDDTFSECKTDSKYLVLKFNKELNFNKQSDEMFQLNFIRQFSMRVRILCLNVHHLLKKPLNSSTYYICNDDINGPIYRLNNTSYTNSIYAISKLKNLFNETPKRVVIVTFTETKKFIETIIFSEKDPEKYELFFEYMNKEIKTLNQNNKSY